MSRRIAYSVLTALVVLTVAGCSLLPRERDTLAPPLVEPMESEVQTALVRKGTIQTQLRGIGSFEPAVVMVHQFERQGGRVTGIHVKAGQTVETGALLFELDRENLDLILMERRLDVKVAETAWKRAKAGQDKDETEIAAMKLDIARLLLDEAQSLASDRTLHARMSGVAIFVDEIVLGDEVEAYQPLVTIADPSSLRLSFQAANPTAAAEARVGMKAEVIVAGTGYEGKVVQTPSSAPRATGKPLADDDANRIYVDVPDLPSSVTFGTHADIRIVLQEKAGTLLIPGSALRTYLGRKYVQILEGESRREVDVETGLYNGTEVEIVAGLSEGQQVILP